ncbi:MAG: hypothetical protein HY240_10790, partial [Actinobacteria bacterium]|nr:hypothetical protein [Actinomycetota bacterium]
DVVVNNADRKSGHCLLGRDGRIWAVDHGVCFGGDDKLRTVIWGFVGEPLPPRLVADLRGLRERLREGPLRAELSALLAPEEMLAVKDRIGAVVAAGRFPAPGAHRPYPWPPV